MSIRATNWAAGQLLAPLQKLVLFVLAHMHHANTGECNPSIHTLAAVTGLSKRSVQYKLRDLEAAGLIRTKRRRRGGVFTSSQYELQFSRRVPSSRVQETADGDGNSGGAARAPNREEIPYGGKAERPVRLDAEDDE